MLKMTPEPQRIDAQAAHWAIRLQAGPLNPMEESELSAWLEADARHRGALLRAQAVWLDLDRLAALGAHGARHEQDAPPAKAVTPTNQRRWFLAAGLSGLALTGTLGWWTWRQGGNVY